MKKFFGVIVTLYALSGGGAHAAWGHMENEDAFSEEVTHIAVGAEGGYGFGFRCSDIDDLVMIYITPESGDDDTVTSINSASPDLLIRVDSDVPQKFTTRFEISNEGTLSAITSTGEITKLAEAVAKAKKRVAVAIEVIGQRMHVRDFNVAGSTKSVEQLINGCKLPE